jgi:Tfp pilus assembly protein PilF
MRETDLDEAERLLLEALELYPDSWQIHHFTAQFYYNQKKMKKADKHISATLRLNPKHEVYLLREKNDRAE